ncbi:LOW QUALITY PROTEIN: inactive dipeptidyl peptidase 10 [Cottoperca gobio]|uniref:LOW QUALITY PROTEIN: inactive dipeptidyl peptidase 10 n=1 Tax=Cottoperca gobio TaxID=56716 RepID=A0A6J2P9Z1_COTGO|nr:LOW QUALITY PROTEIN: inactive dipeptidyl peptidase 10-like [Cottoperca gobio]
MIATTQQNMTTELDLGSSEGPPRNWKGIGIAMVVILAVMSLVILSVIVLTPDESHLLLRSHLTMEDLESEEFKVHDPCVAWLNENEVALCTREGHVLSFGLSSNLTSTLVDNSSLDLSSSKFQVSADKTFVLLACNIRPVFSQSFTASYAIYNVANGDLQELNPPENEKAALQYASWGPQGSQLAYVFDGDLYYKPSVSSRALRLTDTEPEQNVVNGLSDWTYEEEVLLTYVAHWWSMDGARLAYLTINNSATPVMEIPRFLGGLYPSNVLFPYPKAGSSIPSVSLSVVNLYGPAHTLEMMPPDSLRTRDSYISMVTWISSTRLAVRWLNRAQNQSVLCVCEATTGACSEKHKMTMDILQNQRQDVPLFSADASVFYTILPAKQGARGEFHHIAALSAQPAIPSIPPRFLTSGSWDVTLLCALDGKAGKIYFLSAEESRQSRHLYSVDLDGEFQRRCISCHLIDGCRFFKAEFSPNQTYFTLYCQGPGIPKVTVHSTKDPSRYVVLEDNSPLSDALQDKRLPETLFRTLPAENHDLHLKLSLPQGYEANLHPLLVIVDGVPGRRSVTEEFALDWPQVLSGTHGVALAWVDGRSGVGRGQKTAAVDPRKLGSIRVKDYLGVVELLMKLPYIDDRRMLLYGKAFGGYLTLKMLAATEKLFQCTAAVAPITDFRLYSAAFSERYLGLPTKEEHAYSTASLLDEVNKLKDESFLILHGTADARVHFQHSAELLSRLVRVEANYSLQLYPDEGHVLREPRSIQHFQRTLVNYLHTCLKHSVLPDPVEDEEEEDD